MPGTYKGRQGLPLGIDQLFFKGDPLIPGQNRFPGSDEPVPISDDRRHMGDFIPARFTGSGSPAQILKGLPEKGFNIVGLEAPGIGPLHIFPDLSNFPGIHGIVGQGALFKQVPDLLPVQDLVHDRIQVGHDLGLFAVADGLDQQIPQGLALELQFSQDIKYLSAKGVPGLFQFIQKSAVDIAFPGLLGHDIPQVTHFGLADAVDSAEALFKAVGIPGQVIVDHQMGALEVDAFSCRIRGQQNLDLRVVPEGFLDLEALFPANAPMNGDHRRFPAQKGGDSGVKVIQGIFMFSENNQFLLDRGFMGRNGTGPIGLDLFRYAGVS